MIYDGVYFSTFLLRLHLPQNMISEVFFAAKAFATNFTPKRVLWINKYSQFSIRSM